MPQESGDLQDYAGRACHDFDAAIALKFCRHSDFLRETGNQAKTALTPVTPSSTLNLRAKPYILGLQWEGSPSNGVEMGESR